jgi:hypothetical protein
MYACFIPLCLAAG